MLEPFRPRRRRALWGLLAAVLVLAAAALALRPVVERTLRAKLQAEAARRGLELTLGQLRAGLWPPLRLRDVVVEKPGRLRLEAGRVDVWWRGHTRVDLFEAVLRGPAGLSVTADETSWNLVNIRDATQIALVRPVR